MTVAVEHTVSVAFYPNNIPLHPTYIGILRRFINRRGFCGRLGAEETENESFQNYRQGKKAQSHAF